MAERLREIAATAAVEDRFVGHRGIERLRAAYEQLSTAGQANEALSALALLSRAVLSYGLTDEAIGLLRKALVQAQALPPGPTPFVDNIEFELAVALMRLGESQNCVARHTSQSCILPIGPKGVHTDSASVLEARGLFKSLLARAQPQSPLYYASRWLLNVTSMAAGDWPEAVPEDARINFEPPADAVGFQRFTDVASQRGLSMRSLAGGAAAEDFDGDDRLDLLVTTWDPAEPVRLFHNEGDGHFDERAAGAGLGDVLGGFNVLTGDVNGDGAVDALVLRGGWLGDEGRWPSSLLINNGNGTFQDRTADWGLEALAAPTQTGAFADYDRDGDLDLYLAFESEPGRGEYPCRLLRNDGDHFTDVTVATGTTNTSWAKGVAWGDIDGDGDLDLYVSTFQGPNRLFRSLISQGEARFEDVAEAAGVLGPHSSFSTWFWDYDNDGDLDLWVSSYLSDEPGAAFVRYDWAEVDGMGETGDLWYLVADWLGEPGPGERPALYRNRGDGTFEDVAATAGVADITFTMAASFGDLDNDGWLDVYLGTGYPGFEALTPNRAYRGRGDGTFVDVTLAAGLGHLQKGHGVVFADLDNDGDQDLFEQIGGFSAGDRFLSALFENPGNPHHFAVLDLRGTRSNRLAVGAHVAVVIDEGGEQRTLHRWVGLRSSFGSSPHRLEVGLGDATRIARVEVTWPASGDVAVFTDLPADRLIRLTEGELTPQVRALPR